jgi:ribosome-binding factor A
VNHRKARVAQELRDRIAEVLSRHVRDPRLELVTVTDVEVSPDFSLARVYYRALEERGSLEAAIEKAKPFIRRQLAVGLPLRRVPELVFVRDPTPERAARVETILDELHEERERREETDPGDSSPEEGDA